MARTVDQELLLLTIAELVTFFDGEVSYRCIDGWIRRGKLTPVGHDVHGRAMIRFVDAQRVEAEMFGSKRGRPRTTRPNQLFVEPHL